MEAKPRVRARPIPMAELLPDSGNVLQVIKSPTRKKLWNSSVKVHKRIISHTEIKRLETIPETKVIDFQSTTISLNSRKTHVSDSRNFRKPESRVLKSIALKGRDPRISGIRNISETPFVTKQIKSRMSIANKENVASQNNIKKPLSPVAPSHKKLAVTISDTPISSMSWKSSCDAIVLQAEKEINGIKEKTKALTEEQTINNSIICHDDTIMNFDNSAKDIRRYIDSIIVFLCSLLNKDVVKSPSINTELDQLLHIEKVIEYKTKLMEITIDAMKSIEKIIQMKKSLKNDADKTLIEAKENKDENIESKTPATQSK